MFYSFPSMTSSFTLKMAATLIESVIFPEMTIWKASSRDIFFI